VPGACEHAELEEVVERSVVELFVVELFVVDLAVVGDVFMSAVVENMILPSESISNAGQGISKSPPGGGPGGYLPGLMGLSSSQPFPGVVGGQT
jgi:hypothetical protein